MTSVIQSCGTAAVLHCNSFQKHTRIKWMQGQRNGLRILIWLYQKTNKLKAIKVLAVELTIPGTWERQRTNVFR